MVVLAVTWMAKIGRESDVMAIFDKLTAESRKEAGCLMYQVHKHKTDPRRFFIYEQYKDDAALEAHRTAPHFLQLAKKICLRSPTGSKGTYTNRWDSVARALLPAKCRAGTLLAILPAPSAGRSPLLLLLVGHQLAAGSITFLRHFQKCHDDRFAARPASSTIASVMRCAILRF